MKSYEEFLDLAGNRNSCRKYICGKPVPFKFIEECIGAARLSPSACNRQPWRFVIVTDDEKRRNICDRCLMPGIPMPWLRDAPVIVVLCLELSFIVHKAAPFLSGVPYHMLDAGIAGEHFVLAAESLGLGTCWIGWFKEKPVKKVLGIPSSVRIASLISLGWPAEKGRSPEKMPLEKICSQNGWHFKE